MTTANFWLLCGMIHTEFGFDKEDDPDVIGCPPYANSLELSFKVFNKLRESSEYCCLDILSDYDYVWKVKLVKAEDPEHKVFCYVDGVELPMTICLCALKSKGIDIDTFYI